MDSDKDDFNELMDKAYKNKAEGNYTEVLAVLNEAIALYSDSTVIHFAFWERGRIYECLEKYDLALSDINEAIKLEPDLMDCMLYDRISICEKMGEYDLAIRDYISCLNYFENQPKNEKICQFMCSILESRGNLYAKTGNPEKAKADFDRAAQIHK